MKDGSLRILIADDHSIVRSGLTHLLAELGQPVAVTEATCFTQVAEILAGPDAGAFDLITLDLKMPGLDGPDALRGLVARIAPVPVVVFSMLESPEDMRAALATGVRAYIPKSTDDALIINIFRLVLAGGSYVPPVLGTASVRETPAEPSPFAGLTRRQADVLDLLAQGLSNQEISERLGLNLSTVKSHVTGILKVLGVASRTQAALLINQQQGVRNNPGRMPPP